MDDTNARFDAGSTTATLARELRLVREAIDGMTTGRFTRVTVAGLSFGEELLPRARALAAARGLAVQPLFGADEHGMDLAFERPADPERA